MLEQPSPDLSIEDSRAASRRIHNAEHSTTPQPHAKNNAKAHLAFCHSLYLLLQVCILPAQQSSKASEKHHTEVMYSKDYDSSSHALCCSAD